jgi:hypothetical protein
LAHNRNWVEGGWGALTSDFERSSESQHAQE